MLKDARPVRHYTHKARAVACRHDDFSLGNSAFAQFHNCTINFACGRIDLVTRVRLAAGAVTLTAGGGAFKAWLDRSPSFSKISG